MDSICYLYWLHRPCHTDMFTEGYVGITNNPNLRLKQHIKAMKAAKGNHRLYNAMNKYNDFCMKIIVISNREQCLEIEYKLRPVSNIGLNTSVGGKLTLLPDVSVSTKDKLSVAAKQAYLNNPELVNKCGKKNLGKKLTDDHKHKISQGGKGKQAAWNNSLADHSLWKIAEDIYLIFLANPTIGHSALSSKFNLQPHKTKAMLQMFRAGWNPFTDTAYQTYKRKT